LPNCLGDLTYQFAAIYTQLLKYKSLLVSLLYPQTLLQSWDEIGRNEVHPAYHPQRLEEQVELPILAHEATIASPRVRNALISPSYDRQMAADLRFLLSEPPCEKRSNEGIHFERKSDLCPIPYQGQNADYSRFVLRD